MTTRPPGVPSYGRGYYYVLVAGMASTFGGYVGGICLSWLVFDRTHSSISVAYLFVGGTLAAAILSLPAGTIADRTDRRRLMVTMDLLRAAGVAVVGFVFLWTGFVLWEAVALSVLLAGAYVTFNIAEQSILPNLVASRSLGSANGVIRSTRSAVGFFASAGAGLIVVVVGAVVGILSSALTFAISAALVSLIVVGKRGPDPPEAPRGSFLADTVDGFRYLRGERGLLLLTLSALFLNFFFVMTGPFLVVYSTVLLKGNALTFGLLSGLLGLGEILGSLGAGRLGPNAPTGLAWLIGAGPVAGTAMVLMVLLPSAASGGVLCLVLGFGSGLAGTAWLSGAQSIVPEAMRGRYFGVDALGSAAVVPLGALVGGILLASRGVTDTYLIAGGGSILFGLAFVAFPALRRLRAKPGAEDDPATGTVVSSG